MSRFEAIGLLPKAAAYRAFLDHATTACGWEVATAVTTIFLEGTRFERGELDPSSPKRPVTPLEDHPLVKHYGLPLEALALTRVHRQVEGGHREAAWRVMLDHVSRLRRRAVVAAMEETLHRWKAYRDEVAEACGLQRTPDAVRAAS